MSTNTTNFTSLSGINKSEISRIEQAILRATTEEEVIRLETALLTGEWNKTLENLENFSNIDYFISILPIGRWAGRFLKKKLVFQKYNFLHFQCVFFSY